MTQLISGLDKSTAQPIIREALMDSQGRLIVVGLSSLVIPPNTSGTVTYGSTTVTYAFFNGATQVATLVLTYDGVPTDSASNLTAWAVAFP